MKKFLIIPILSIALLSRAWAQDFKVNKNSGKLVINLSSVTVEGYNGSQIVFKSTKNEADADPRAKGLRAINGSGLIDNTGLGISVVEKGTALEVNQVAFSDIGITIQVPRNVVLSFVCHTIHAGDVIFKNLSNEIEISTEYNKVELRNVTGPASVRAIYGSVDATFSEHIKGPVSIASIYSTVDVTIPQETRANLKLSSSHGEILAAADLKIVLEKSAGSDFIDYGSTVHGKLNGGGTDFKLTSEYGKIYLRKNN